MEVELELKGRNIAPLMRKRLYEALEASRWFIDIGLGDTVSNIIHYSSVMLSMLEGEGEIRDASSAESVFDSISVMLSDYESTLSYEIEPGERFTYLEEGEFLMESGKVFSMESWLVEKSSSLWRESEAAVESLWVGGMLYSPEIVDNMAVILRSAADLARILGSMEMVFPQYILKYNSYFSGKYGVYYSVYEKAECTEAFAPQGQKRLNKLARELHKREKFFKAMLKSYDEIRDELKDPMDFAPLFEGFEGPDRRIEILKRLTHESDMVYGGFSTFNPVETMKHLMEEIRADYYGGIYVPLGEDEASYKCIVPQLREAWLSKNKK